MTRLIPGCTLVGLMLTLLPAPTSAAGSNTATTLFPVDEVTQLETHTFLDCHPNGSCDFVAGANLRTPDGPTGFPPGLWARQTTEIRSTNRLAYLDAHATSQFERVMKGADPT
ncbi:putative secreted protein [Mycobacterium tuberculosis]|nr:putative secreted protein [Mycobacterium tuberculosis]CKQ48637.1 putative secreted protein [Mycobacterium tuberculosis]